MMPVNDTIPTPSGTGFGVSPTVTLTAGSTARSGIITVTCGVSASTAGTLTLTFNQMLGAACVPCVHYMDGTGSWSTPSSSVVTAASNTTWTVVWRNTGALLNGSSYKFVYTTLLLG